jgi:hypothetical protein
MLLISIFGRVTMQPKLVKVYIERDSIVFSVDNNNIIVEDISMFPSIKEIAGKDIIANVNLCSVFIYRSGTKEQVIYSLESYQII